MDPSTLLSMIPAPYLPYAFAAVAACAAVATVLPPPKTSGGIYAGLYHTVNFIALNFGHAKNASMPASEQQVAQ